MRKEGVKKRRGEKKKRKEKNKGKYLCYNCVKVAQDRIVRANCLILFFFQLFAASWRNVYIAGISEHVGMFRSDHVQAYNKY